MEGITPKDINSPLGKSPPSTLKPTTTKRKFMLYPQRMANVGNVVDGATTAGPCAQCPGIDDGLISLRQRDSKRLELPPGRYKRLSWFHRTDTCSWIPSFSSAKDKAPSPRRQNGPGSDGIGSRRRRTYWKNHVADCYGNMERHTVHRDGKTHPSPRFVPVSTGLAMPIIRKSTAKAAHTNPDKNDNVMDGTAGESLSQNCAYKASSKPTTLAGTTVPRWT